jgi:HPr kinase/phosphorylase
MPPSAKVADDTVHATCVAIAKRGLLIIGPSASGKSALALALMALGATLVADDRTLLMNKAGRLIAKCPPSIRGLIEARGLGLLRAETVASAPITLVVDLGQTETDRLPPHRNTSLCGVTCDLVLGQQSPHFPSFLMAYMMGGRQA